MTGKVSAAPEAVDRSAMSVAVSPALQAMADDGASPAAIANVIAACAEATRSELVAWSTRRSS